MELAAFCETLLHRWAAKCSRVCRGSSVDGVFFKRGNVFEGDSGELRLHDLQLVLEAVVLLFFLELQRDFVGELHFAKCFF